MREKNPTDNPAPGSEQISAAAKVHIDAGDGNPQQAQLADLQEIEQRFQTVFEEAPIGIAAANPEGYFLEVNDAFAKMLGYSHREIVDMTFVDITHPDDRAETQQLSQAVREGEVNSYQSEKRYSKKRRWRGVGCCEGNGHPER